VLFALDEFGSAFSFEGPQVLDMGIAVAGFQEIQLFTGCENFALPAPIDIFFLAAFSDLAEWRTASFFTDSFTTKFDESSQKIVSLWTCRR